MAKTASNFVMKLDKGTPLPTFHALFEPITQCMAEMSTAPNMLQVLQKITQLAVAVLCQSANLF